MEIASASVSSYSNESYPVDKGCQGVTAITVVPSSSIPLTLVSPSPLPRIFILIPEFWLGLVIVASFTSKVSVMAGTLSNDIAETSSSGIV